MNGFHVLVWCMAIAAVAALIAAAFVARSKRITTCEKCEGTGRFERGPCPECNPELP